MLLLLYPAWAGSEPTPTPTPAQKLFGIGIPSLRRVLKIKRDTRKENMRALALLLLMSEE